MSWRDRIFQPAVPQRRVRLPIWKWSPAVGGYYLLHPATSTSAPVFAVAVRPSKDAAAIPGSDMEIVAWWMRIVGEGDELEIVPNELMSRTVSEKEALAGVMLPHWLAPLNMAPGMRKAPGGPCWAGALGSERRCVRHGARELDDQGLCEVGRTPLCKHGYPPDDCPLECT